MSQQQPDFELEESSRPETPVAKPIELSAHPFSISSSTEPLTPPLRPQPDIRPQPRVQRVRRVRVTVVHCPPAQRDYQIDLSFVARIVELHGALPQEDIHRARLDSREWRKNPNCSTLLPGHKREVNAIITARRRQLQQAQNDGRSIGSFWFRRDLSSDELWSVSNLATRLNLVQNRVYVALDVDLQWIKRWCNQILNYGFVTVGLSGQVIKTVSLAPVSIRAPPENHDSGWDY